MQAGAVLLVSATIRPRTPHSSITHASPPDATTTTPPTHPLPTLPSTSPPPLSPPSLPTRRSACQSKAWPQHKLLCAVLREAAQAAEVDGDTMALLDGFSAGDVGIINRDAVTCYAAAPLQALSAVWPLTRVFLNGSWATQLNLAGRDGSKGAAVAIAYAATMQQLWKQPAPTCPAIYPTALYAAMKERFKTVAQSGEQHDAHGAWVCGCAGVRWVIWVGRGASPQPRPLPTPVPPILSSHRRVPHRPYRHPCGGPVPGARHAAPAGRRVAGPARAHTHAGCGRHASVAHSA